jgi:hypothetical protein
VSHYIEISDTSTSDNTRMLSGVEASDYFTDQNVKFKVETKNYNDQVLKKSYTAKLSKLEEPKRILEIVLRTKFKTFLF